MILGVNCYRLSVINVRSMKAVQVRIINQKHEANGNLLTVSSFSGAGDMLSMEESESGH